MVVGAMDPASNHNNFEALHQASHTRRLRPTDPAVTTNDENRVPLRPEKLSKRESRIGLRSLFGRQKAGNEDDGGAKDVPGRSGGIRASFVGNWPYGSHGQRSEATLPFFSHSSLVDDHMKHKKSASAARPPASPRSTQRATWDPPPLFQAYPQAIKHVTLPACILPTDSILRLHGQRGGHHVKDAGDYMEGSPSDKYGKPRRRHRRNSSGSSFKWTTKIYVLATSGYLLQYAGEGPFDRLPERILHLGKDSAAFASDVIPGRHWVLQVSSAMDPDGPPTSQSNSLFSRLQSRVVEKRQSPNFLMVFESAENMESWIVTLRREIEALGGKKSLSEIGKPKVDDGSLRLKAQPSQRTLVVRDPARFSKVLSQEIPWDQAAAVVAAATNANLDIHSLRLDSEGNPDRSFDDTSTASVISQDSRQLDGLRDSTHRLSYMSSGQRTMLTSAGSSPACSPVRDSFGSQLDSHFEDEPSGDQGQPQDSQPCPRPRPNAAAILDRRQSMQTANHLAEMRVAAVLPRSYSTTWQPQPPSSLSHGTSPSQTIPNFSVPQSVGKRFSVTIQPPQETTPNQSPVTHRANRRPPPSAIAINPRPLSLVVDQPSPNPSTPGSIDKQLALPDEVIVPDTPSIFSARGRKDPSVDANVEAPVHCRPRKHASTTTMRTSRTATETREELHSMSFSAEDFPTLPTSQQWRSRTSSRPVIPPLRSASSMEHRRPTASQAHSSTASVSGLAQHKRLSVHASSSWSYPTIDSEISVTATPVGARDSSIRAHSPSLFKLPPTNVSSLPSKDCSSIDTSTQGLYGRRSMPRLAEISPPAPPPTSALPPIPLPRRG